MNVIGDRQGAKDRLGLRLPAGLVARRQVGCLFVSAAGRGLRCARCAWCGSLLVFGFGLAEGAGEVVLTAGVGGWAVPRPFGDEGDGLLGVLVGDAVFE